jgi:hypothetical protein
MREWRLRLVLLCSAAPALGLAGGNRSVACVDDHTLLLPRGSPAAPAVEAFCGARFGNGPAAPPAAATCAASLGAAVSGIRGEGVLRIPLTIGEVGVVGGQWTAVSARVALPIVVDDDGRAGNAY